MSKVAPRPLIIDGQNIIGAGVYERPVSERPLHDTIEGISRWLAGPARAHSSFTRTFDEFAWRLAAAGVSLTRTSLHGGTLHPQFLGATYVWFRDEARTRKIMITHEVKDLVPYEQNPVRRVREGGETFRRRLDEPDPAFDFSVLRDMRELGATEYYAFPVVSPFGFGAYMAAFVTDRPGGFLDEEIRELGALAGELAVIADMNSQRQIAHNVLSAYLGPRTGPRVLAGQIRRGGGETISAVLWSSDLRGFTALSDRLPGERVIEILNTVFDLQAMAITRRGGEVLKFVGDGLLAVFPVASPEDAPRAAAEALAAARESLAAIVAEADPPLAIVVALHYGTVIYGNIGAADRLDFTVIGPAVNLVSRIEAVAKSRDLPLIVSDDFAALSAEPLPSIGMHALRGLDRPHELFAPRVSTPPRGDEA
jgi:adenylate cyclase